MDKQTNLNLENKPKLAKAVIAVMKAVDGVEKGMTVGTGGSSYKGVSDKDVKLIYKKAMSENGLCILPIDVHPNVTIERWEEESNYGKKQKQSVFTEVVTKYLLMHESGESVVISGYGHGVDSQDKGAGKSTTYALKYALLYMFMTPTGDIDDSDKTHSNDTPTPTKVTDKPTLVEGSETWQAVEKALKSKKFTVAQVLSKYTVDAPTLKKLKAL